MKIRKRDVDNSVYSESWGDYQDTQQMQVAALRDFYCGPKSLTISEGKPPVHVEKTRVPWTKEVADFVVRATRWQMFEMSASLNFKRVVVNGRMYFEY